MTSRNILYKRVVPPTLKRMTSTAVDRGFEPWSGQIKTKTINVFAASR